MHTFSHNKQGAAVGGFFSNAIHCGEALSTSNRVMSHAVSCLMATLVSLASAWQQPALLPRGAPMPPPALPQGVPFLSTRHLKPLNRVVQLPVEL